MKRLKTFTGLKAGDKIIVEANGNGHNYPMNTPLTLKIKGVGLAMSNCVMEGNGYNTLNANDCILAGTYSIEEMKKQKEILIKELDALDFKISFCEENGLEEYDDIYHKVSEILKALESKKLSKNEKIVKITKLVKEVG